MLMRSSALWACPVRALSSGIYRPTFCVRCASKRSGTPLLVRQDMPSGDANGKGDRHCPWQDLDLGTAVYGKGNNLGGRRVRQHVNPLKAELQRAAPPPDWDAVYEEPGLPLVVDVGCGSGRFLLALAKRRPGRNYLGLDIKNKLVERANAWARLLALERAAVFRFANATASLANLLSTYPGLLELVTIQFPDPHFKNRHKKRRVVQPELIAAIAAHMPQGGHVLLQSDVEEAAAAMRDGFEAFCGAAFAPAPEHYGGASLPIHHAEAALKGMHCGAVKASPDGGERSGTLASPSGCALESSTAAAAVPNGWNRSATPASAFSEALECTGSAAVAGPADGDGFGDGAARTGPGAEMQQQRQACIGVGSASHPQALPEASEGTRGARSIAPEQPGLTGNVRRRLGVAALLGSWAAAGWLPSNPLGVVTEREVQTLREGRLVYRVLLVRR